MTTRKCDIDMERWSVHVPFKRGRATLLDYASALLILFFLITAEGKPIPLSSLNRYSLIFGKNTLKFRCFGDVRALSVLHVYLRAIRLQSLLVLPFSRQTDFSPFLAFFRCFNTGCGLIPTSPFFFCSFSFCFVLFSFFFFFIILEV